MEIIEGLWEQACALHLERKFDEAEKIYIKLLEQNHDNAGLLATLGTLYVQTEKQGLGIHLLEAAVKGGLKQTDVYTNLGLAYKNSGQIKKAREYFDESVKDDPSPEALANYSGLLIESGNDAGCKDYCERALKINPQLPLAHWNLALCLLSEGAWDRAWEEHDWGLKTQGIREDRVVLNVPVWDGKAPGTVLVYGEQGIGDEIMFASMLPDLLKTNKIVFECYHRLENLFKAAFPGVPIYGTREDKEVAWAYDHTIDYRIPIGSLGQFYRRSRESFPGTPYLKSESLPKGDKFRVGISWIGGGAKQGRVVKRSVPLSWWKTILEIPNVEFVSLQYTNSNEEIDLVNALGYDIKKFKEVKEKDYYETAKLVKSCDLVISVCTSVIHLAGALGVPCWVMTPKYPAWRYQNTGGMPWYRSVRLYRSPSVEMDGWPAVIGRIGIDLEELVSGEEVKKLRVA
jgi:tetratricopeptide (TPR) repeat protein